MLITPWQCFHRHAEAARQKHGVGDKSVITEVQLTSATYKRTQHLSGYETKGETRSTVKTAMDRRDTQTLLHSHLKETVTAGSRQHF